MVCVVPALDQAYVTPVAGVAVAVPVVPQLAVEEAPAVTLPSATVVEAVPVHPFWSVTVTVNVPGARLIMEAVVAPLDHI